MHFKPSKSYKNNFEETSHEIRKKKSIVQIKYIYIRFMSVDYTTYKPI